MKEAIFEMYKKIAVGNNEVCKECNKDKELEIPLSIYFVGEYFFTQNDTILFVGKTAVGGMGIGPIIDNFFTDASSFGEGSLDGVRHKSNFYSYTKQIITQYYDSYKEGKKFISVSNIIKCNNGSIKDETTYNIKESCITKLQVIWEEVKILKPKRIIFYTGRHYDNFIEAFIPINFDSYIDKREDNKQAYWWHRKYFSKEKTTICDILRIYHPDYMRYKNRQTRQEYISKVIDWLHETK